MSWEDWCLARARVSSKPHWRITVDDKMAFFQQLATLVSSGTPLLQSIQNCSQQCQSNRLSQILREIEGGLAAGSSLHGAMAQYEDVFEPHWIGVIQTGEISGKLGLVLADLNRQIREQRQTRRKLMGAMIYPATLVVVAIAAVAIMLWLVVPTFAEMFRDMGAELPGITKFVMAASDFVLDYGLYIGVGLFVIAYLFRRYLKSEGGRRRAITVALTWPLIGELIVQACMYRFASNTALLLKSGVPLLEALATLRGVFQTNPVYREALDIVQRRVAAGRTFAESLEATGLFTRMLTDMVRTGEESGHLATVMDEIAPYYRDKVEAMTTKVTKLLEPAIIIVMGGMIATVMMSIYLPMFELAGKIN